MRRIHLIMMFVLLTFVGQTFASVIMPGTMPMNSMTTSNMPAENGKACHDASMQMNMNMNMNMDMSDDADDSCCAQACHCPVGSCLSVALTMAMPTLKSEVSLVNAATMFTSALMPQYRSSLYRPPIFA
ncbi:MULTISPECIES: hypothetical protein [Shewanella]|uniref:CopL family metal-binding regulatory protein n=1 Tax=Shewanella metallivivens TaxID=2872342 RepID=A0ABT5TP37_9GAMM|nr:hypothetical protein [Shewanella metallivivens]MDD8060386.1 hypothetical protein [Shewanella metallivivens]